jgi:hypothetical protein
MTSGRRPIRGRVEIILIRNNQMADNDSSAVRAANLYFRPSAAQEEERGTGSGAESQMKATAEKTARLRAARLERDAAAAAEGTSKIR